VGAVVEVSGVEAACVDAAELMSPVPAELPQQPR